MKRFIMAIFFIGCAPLHLSSASSADEQKLAAANNGFAFNFLKELAKEQPAANIFISPYSAATVLQMVANGAAGLTKTEMQQVLATQNMPGNSMSAAVNNLHLPAWDRPSGRTAALCRGPFGHVCFPARYEFQS